MVRDMDVGLATIAACVPFLPPVRFGSRSGVSATGPLSLRYRPANRIRPLPYDCGSIPTRSASDVQRLGSPLDTWVGKDPMQPFRRRCRTASMRSVPIRGFQGISGGTVKRQGGWAVVEQGRTEGVLSKWCARQDLNL